jgi:hypothetical protein
MSIVTRMRRLGGVLACVLLLGCLAACGDAGNPGFNGEPENTPGTNPKDVKLVNCPGGGGPSSGSLTGLGATIGQFRQAHPQDPKYTSDFGEIISGGPNDGRHELTASCTAAGVVVFVSQNLSQPMTDAKVKASVLSLGIAPADSKFEKKLTLKPCELFFYRSASLGAAPGTNDEAGTFVVDLIPPGSDWNAMDVESLIYDLETTPEC